MKSFPAFVAALLAGVCLPVSALAQSPQPVVELQGGLSYGTGNGSIGITFPFTLDDGSYLFIEGRGGMAEQSVRFGSFGAGLRRKLDNGLILGGYGYYDALRTARGNTFQQLSFGAELFGNVFEARANAYLPLTGSRLAEEFNSAYVSGDQLLFQSGRERARAGVDAEVGARLPVFPRDAQAQFKLFGGAYWYEGKNMDDTVGARARAELVLAGLPGVRPDATLSLGTSLSYDNEEHLEAGLRVRLRIPLGAGGSASSTTAFDPLYQPVEREEKVRTHLGTTGNVEAAEYVSSGQTVGKVVTIGPNSGDASTINGSLAAAGDNALALASGEIALTQALLLGTSQHLIGGGGTLAVRGAESGLEATFRNDGAATTLRGTNPLADVVSMASGSEIASVTITGGLAAIQSTGAANILIHDVDISGTAGDGIRLENVTGATIANAYIHDLYICENNTTCEFAVGRPNDAPHAAVSALGTSGLTVRDTVIEGVTYGIFAGSHIDDSGWPPAITSAATDITIDNVSITRSRREGILLVAANDVTMNKVTIDNSAQDRDMDLVVLQGTSDVTITNMALKGGVNGLMLITSSTLPDAAVTTNVRVNGFSSDGASNTGIFLNPVGDISFNNVSITNPGTYGVFIYGSDYAFLGGPVNNIDFGTTSISTAGQAGLYFMGPSIDLKGNVTVAGTPKDCLVSAWGSWVGGSLTQNPGSVLNVNGAVLDGSNFQSRCMP